MVRTLYIRGNAAPRAAKAYSRPNIIATSIGLALFLSSCVSQQSTVSSNLTQASLSSTQEGSSSQSDALTGAAQSGEQLAETNGVNAGDETQLASISSSAGSPTNSIPIRSPRATNNVVTAETTGSTATPSNALAIVDTSSAQNTVIAAAVAEPATGTSQTTTVAALAPSVADAPKAQVKKPRRSLFSFPKRTAKKPRPQRTLASLRRTKKSGNALPGVKSNNELFGITESQNNDDIRATQVAAVGSFGRLSPNGLRVQHEKVQVACLKPGILRIIKIVERRYRSKPIITSGYRSPKGNSRAGGARNSQHIFCKAVDIQVEGVSKWDLAKYMRSIPGRGGVGTYCRTKSVHIDTGSVRDWHHPCRRSSVRKRKKRT